MYVYMYVFERGGREGERKEEKPVPKLQPRHVT